MITPEKDAAHEPYTLLALAQSGEILIVQNGAQRVWMMSIYYPNHEITRDSGPGHALHNDWILCEQSFLTWDELHQYVRQNAVVSNWRPPEYAQYDAAEITQTISEIESCDTLETLTVGRDVLMNIREKSIILASDGKSRQQVLQALRRVEQRTSAPPGASSREASPCQQSISRTAPR